MFDYTGGLIVKKKIILLAVAILTVGLLTACVDQGSVLPASSYVDYPFDEYTPSGSEKPTEATTAKSTEKKKESTTKKTTNNKEKTTEAATKKN